MEVSTLIGETFECYSIGENEMQKWSIVKHNNETNYVYVERDNGDGKLGQWIPAMWVPHLLAPKKFAKRIDALRKSRDYFKNERDELNKRVTSISIKHESEALNMIHEVEYLRTELDSLERDIRFWKLFSISVTGVCLLLGAALLAARLIFC